MSINTQNAPEFVPAGTSARSAGITARDDLVLGGAAVVMGLMAGLFFTFSVAIMPGLSAAADETLVDAMQHINRSIENPVFLAAYLGTPVLALWALLDERRRGSREAVRWIAAGFGLYAVAFLVTGALSIPLNDTLDAAGDPAGIADIAQVREDYLGPWLIWNAVRTVAVTAGTACLVRAIFLRNRKER